MICPAFELFFCNFVIFFSRGSHSFKLLEEKYGKVILVNTILRHGERSVVHSYPTDPYRGYKWPDGEGQLLQVGKRRVFEEGVWFKRRYGRLLRTANSHTNITMFSSGIDRTIMSGQCFLAGFLTPSDRVSIKNLKSHAVPVHSNPLPKENVLLVRKDCGMYDEFLKKYYDSELAKNIFDEYQKGLFQILRDHSGFKFSRKNMSDCYKKVDMLHDALSVQSANNFKLPSWTKKIFPEPLSGARTRLYAGPLNKLKMKKLTAGPLLKAISENMVKKRRNESTRIFHFYSGHDHTLINIMSALKIFDEIWPPYRSSLVFELREKNSEQFVTIFYKNSTTSDPIYLQLPRCRKGRICPLKTFLNVTKHFVLNDTNLECKIGEK